jgi:hypothetical protein
MDALVLNRLFYRYIKLLPDEKKMYNASSQEIASAIWEDFHDLPRELCDSEFDGKQG